MTFTLPEQLPDTTAELDKLFEQATAEINVIQARNKAGQKLEEADVDYLEQLLQSVDTVNTARASAATKEQEFTDRAQNALQRAEAATAPPAPEPDEQPEGEQPEGQQPVEAEVVEETETPAAELEPVPAAVPAVSFRGIGAGSEGGEPPVDVQVTPGWEMDPSCPGYTNGVGRVGFLELAKHIDSVRPGSRTRNRPNKPTATAFAAQVLARLQRDGMEEIKDAHHLFKAVTEATDETRLKGGSLIAAGGWCSPSEQVYDFCDVPNASDLISLPDLVINRGGIRWPREPDLTDLFLDWEWFFTETELEAIDSGTGEPTAVKQCVDIPCPDEFDEIRLNATGYCVEAGILQTQGWPELIAWFMASLAQEHLRAMSRRTILDMETNSTAHTLSDVNLVGVVPAVLNAMAFRAATLRLQRGLPRQATIEAVLPAWLPEAMRADALMMESRHNLTDAEINSLFAARNIAVQWVGDWQSRGTNEVGNLDNLWYPATVKTVMYPAGTWFRSLSPVIELGTMYPKEQLQVNRYTRFFTEDAIAVGKRCGVSEVDTIPICVSGGYGGPVAIGCETP